MTISSSKLPSCVVVSWRSVLVSAVLAGGLFCGCGANATGELSGSDLKGLIAGKRVYLAVPAGGEFPLYYRADGRVDGTGEAIGLGRFLKPKDSGRWWIEGSRLCQQWQSWYDGKEFCFTIRTAGLNWIFWVRDDGLSGAARIGQ